MQWLTQESHINRIMQNTNENFSFKKYAWSQFKKNKIALVSFTAFIEENLLFKGSFIDCKLAAHAAPGRGGFSCGFAQMENVNGYCIVTDPKGDSLVAKLECSSGATITQKVRCEGRLDFISGTGKYAGASGFARLNMDQIFTISNEEIKFTGFIKLPAISLQ